MYVQKALASTDEGKVRLKELDDWARPRQEQLAKLDKDINDLKNEILAKQGSASDDTLSQLNRELVTRQREFEDRQRDGKRDFGQQIEIRCWDSVDARAATPTRLPYETLERIAGKIVKDVPGVVSVTYNISTKPPSTIEAV